MEKFAVDLDKVLDDFEFNEDCAEQIASVSCPPSNVAGVLNKNVAGPSTSTNYSPNAIESSRKNKGFKITLPFDKSTDSQQIDADNRSLVTEKEIAKENINYCRRESVENVDSVNHYYPHEYIADNKITQKQNIQESEQASLTIYNDISSQKLLQKQQNGGTTKIQNTYDKKLNQPNIKPSVSNVFSSLNEYINAPTVSVNYVDAVLDEQDNRNSKRSDIVKDGIETLAIDTSLKDNLTKDSLSSHRTNVLSERAIDVNTNFASFQNISLPSTVQLFSDNKNDEYNLERVSQLNPIETNNAETVTAKTNVQELSQVYEEICTNANIVQSEELSTVINRSDVKINEYCNIHVENKENVSQPIPTTEFLDVEITDTTVHSNNLHEEEQDMHNFCTQIPEFEPGPSISLPKESNKSDTIVYDTPRKPVGFSNIDDLSEEELKRYLAELEEEEGIAEKVIPYQNTELPKFHKEMESDSQNTFQHQFSNETANKSSMYESIVPTDLPSTSNENFQNEEYEKPVASIPSNLIQEETFKTIEGSTNVNYVEEDKMKDEYCKRVDNTISDVYSSSISNSDMLIESENVVQDYTFLENRDKVENTETVEHPENISQSKTEIETKEDIECKFDQTQTNEEAADLQNNCNALCDMETGLVSYDSATGNTQQFSMEESAKNIRSSSETRKQDENTPEAEKPVRPQTLDIQLPAGMEQQQISPDNAPVAPEHTGTENIESHYQEPSPDISDNSLMEPNIILGKQPPFWIPDSDAPSCMLCDMKFTVLKRRHHCRACGKVLCNKCCNMKFRLEYQGNIDSRVCVSCYQLLVKAESDQGMGEWSSSYANNPSSSEINSPQGRQPNPNNPMEYCSTIPPLQQLAGSLPPPPTVMVPVGVLKREGSTKQRAEGPKSVMFSDGIRPGCDLTELDSSWDLKPPYRKAGGSKRVTTPGQQLASSAKKQNLPPLDASTNSYIPQDPNSLPPTVTMHKGQISYHNVVDPGLLYKSLKNECEPPVMFAINRNLYAYVKITNLNCCVNKICWNITSRGLACVGQDEVILLVETLPDETQVPKDLLLCINQMYLEALKGNTISELGFSIYQGGNLLGSREHAGFLFIRQTLQCLQKIVLPSAPFLVGLLVHRWETPWAKVFPLRLLLRLGAEYRYYPCPLVSVRFRNALYFEIGHTVMKVLADFRNFGYTLPSVRGLTIHLKNRTTDVMFPRNRYDQVIKGLNNSNDHVLAYASNFSITADSHLVCIQTNSGDESSYQTQAINIQNKPRTVTAASFIVINGALKSSMGLSAKSSIVEDGLMVEIMPEKMEALKAALKNMLDFSIGCGKLGAAEPDETVNIIWVENDTQFNLGVKSPIDGQLMDGIPSIRVHNGVDYKGTSRIIRWTEVFIIKSDDHPNGVHDPVDINKLSESIARATCTALVKLLDLLATAGLTKLGVRTTIHPDNVGYEAGSEGTKLPPIYMNSLDNELIQVLHKAAQSSQDTHTVLELIFYILDD